MQDMPENEAIKVMRDSCGSVWSAELNIYFSPRRSQHFLHICKVSIYKFNILIDWVLYHNVISIKIGV